MLILCVYMGLRHQNVGGVVGAFMLGYALDAFSGTDVGLNAFAMTFVFLIVYLMSRRLWIEGGLASAVVVSAAAVVKTLALAGLAAAFALTAAAEQPSVDVEAAVEALAQLGLGEPVEELPGDAPVVIPHPAAPDASQAARGKSAGKARGAKRRSA